MVKMELSEIRTQTADINSYCQSLKEGANHLHFATEGLILELGIGGTAGNSIKSYLSSMYPALAKAMLLHAQSIEEANQAYVDGYISLCGEKSLDSEVLEKQIGDYNASIQSLATSKENQESWYRSQDVVMQQAIQVDYREVMSGLTSSIATNEVERAKIQEKLDNLLAFNGNSASYFNSVSESASLMDEGLKILGGDPSTGEIGAGSWNGAGFSLPAGDWRTRVNEKWKTRDTPEKRKKAVLENSISELELPEAAKDYYKEIMEEALKNVPVDQWEAAVKELNQLLIFDDEGNILRVVPVYFAGDGVIILKNGVNDQELTVQANHEFDAQRFALLKENFPQLVAGVVETLLGVGITGLDLTGTYFSGGTLALVGVSQAGAVAGTTITGVGAATVVDAISKIGVSAGSVNYSFAKNYGDRQNTSYTNQINKQINSGKAPKGVKRADKGFSDVEDAQDHIHFDDSRWTLNRDGTWGHNSSGQPPKLTKKLLKWLQDIGWKLP
ncbi:hypothetical protein ACWOFR_00180 [Carnobacterium gallinarum]|uniref:hypothetical protein n=1 Tax=Carnobacterium gallinarum TaxID=2749 RepID=UPI0005573943|nr:hypothetical protein [Carnobacterium gallinarum]